MSDLVVTVPKGIWPDWIDEGDAVGEPETGIEWSFFVGGPKPPIGPGERLYVVSWCRIRGYAPVLRVDRTPRGWAIMRGGGAVSVTIDEPVPGFRGWQKVWWPREAEKPFPDWMTGGLGEKERAEVELLNRCRARRLARAAEVRCG
ncbi:hypothetical protein [Sorangium sp. So ce1024]|uniref:hypothetical protein n=1 Tax=Sorangium sp. So ce1024 TaxID=3133327 RepID=UPI003F0D70F4